MDEKSKAGDLKAEIVKKILSPTARGGFASRTTAIGREFMKFITTNNANQRH